MVDTINKTVGELINVGAIVNTASEPDAPYHVRIGAVRSLSRVLRKFSNNDDLWNKLTQHVMRSTPVDSLGSSNATVAQLNEALADLLAEHHAALLVRTGYRIPPPPPAACLVDQTRAMVAKALLSPTARLQEVEGARGALTSFVNEVEKHMFVAKDGTVHVSARDRILGPLLGHGRRTIIAGAMAGAVLSSVLGGVEVETAPEWNIDIGTSIEHPLQLKIDVPRPWDVHTAGIIAPAASVSNLHHEALTGAKALSGGLI